MMEPLAHHVLLDHVIQRQRLPKKNLLQKMLSLTQQQVCLAHNENDPAQRDRCLVNAASRSDTSPDVRPMDLPVRNGQMGD